MIIFHRQDHIRILCLICTGLMLITSICNIIYIIRRSIWYNHDEITLKSDIRFRQQSLQTPQKIINENDLIENSIKTNNERFQEAYRSFLNSFVRHFSHISTNNHTNISLNYCPPVPPDLQGPLTTFNPPENFSLNEMNSAPIHIDVQLGGHWQPIDCLARHKIAIIVPYRDRLEILRHFLFHTHHLLKRQQLDYRIYVCEQAFSKTFNKGIVMNGCFKEILKFQPNTPCFIMHDVDLLLIDDRNMYTCPQNPRHLSVAVDKFQFYLPYTALVGGVLAMRREHYVLVNGYSTNYWGWGGEDDDMYSRIMNKKLKLERPPASIARYKMLKHTHQKLNPARLKVLRTAHIRIDSDGVNNVKYKLLNVTFYHLYTHFLIDVGEQHE